MRRRLTTRRLHVVASRLGVDESGLPVGPGYHREFRGIVLGLFKESALEVGVQCEEKGLAKGKENFKS